LPLTTTDTFCENSFSYGAGADVALISDRLYLTRLHRRHQAGRALKPAPRALG
jgi:hypothetical protein